jgi:hypothetical protein
MGMADGLLGHGERRERRAARRKKQDHEGERRQAKLG